MIESLDAKEQGKRGEYEEWMAAKEP